MVSKEGFGVVLLIIKKREGDGGRSLYGLQQECLLWYLKRRDTKHCCELCYCDGPYFSWTSTAKVWDKTPPTESKSARSLVFVGEDGGEMIWLTLLVHPKPGDVAYTQKKCPHCRAWLIYNCQYTQKYNVYRTNATLFCPSIETNIYFTSLYQVNKLFS